MKDLIYRQDAIDALDVNDRFADARCPEWYVDAIEQVPSAEPEIIRCKDCKNYYPDEDGRGYHCERDSNVRFSVHKDFYCADAERRIDE